MMWSGVMAATGVFAAGLEGVSAADPLGPGSGPWVVETPEAHGVSTEALERGKQELFNTARTRNCYVVIKDGALIHESYGGRNGPDSAFTAWSMTKTLGGLLMGRGVTAYGVNIDADITQTYGVKSPVSYPVTSRQIMSQAIAGRDYPGQKWEYDAVGSRWLESLPGILQSATGIEPARLFETDMKGPMGLSSNFKWKPSPNKDWAAGTEGTCRDWARIGQLMLNKGRWAGHGPIVREDYINQMTTPQRFNSTAEYSNTCYGMLTWLSTRPQAKYPGKCYLATDIEVTADRFMPASLGNEYYLMGGIFGQNVVIIPGQNMVVVSMGTTIPDLQGLTKNAQKMVNAAWCIGLNKSC